MKARKFVLALICLVVLASCMAGCAGLQQAYQKDPVGESLYLFKQDWVSFRASVITSCAKKEITSEQCLDFQATDAQVQQVYEEVTGLYLKKGDPAYIQQRMDFLRKLALDARKKYLPSPIKVGKAGGV